jgi:hypothetical protein
MKVGCRPDPFFPLRRSVARKACDHGVALRSPTMTMGTVCSARPATAASSASQTAAQGPRRRAAGTVACGWRRTARSRAACLVMPSARPTAAWLAPSAYAKWTSRSTMASSRASVAVSTARRCRGPTSAAIKPRMTPRCRRSASVHTSTTLPPDRGIVAEPQHRPRTLSTRTVTQARPRASTDRCGPLPDSSERAKPVGRRAHYRHAWERDRRMQRAATNSALVDRGVT